MEELECFFWYQDHSDGTKCRWMFVWMVGSETQNMFFTKLDMVMQHHEPECHAEKNCLLSSRSRSQRGLIWSKYEPFYYIFWTVDSLATKLCPMIHYHKPECPVKKIGLLHSRSRSQWRSKCQCLSKWYLLNRQTFCYQNMVTSSWARVLCRKIGLLFSRSRLQWRLKTLLNLHVLYIFCTTDLLGTKLGVLSYYW